ncbi:MAG: hypothetical protein HZC37_07710 [Burkholderiales bacterium]|nr:hypothetical protein [Burkholderiales bacterium]
MPPAAAVLYGCITHVEPWFELPDDVALIRLGAAQDGAVAGHTLRELAPQWEPFHPVIGGAAGSFALKALLLRQAVRPAFVGVCQYRKFVSPGRVSETRARGYKVMDAVPREQVTRAALEGWLQQPGPHGFLVCPPFSMHREAGYLGQYGTHHHAEDLLRFTAEAVVQGALSGREAAEFMREPVFFPGGIELGVYPADFWLEGIDAIERVIEACVRRYPTARTGTQGRVWAYCAERLGSWQLVREFRRRQPCAGIRRLEIARWRQRFAGRMNLVVEAGESRYQVGQ